MHDIIRWLSCVGEDIVGMCVFICAGWSGWVRRSSIFISLGARQSAGGYDMYVLICIERGQQSDLLVFLSSWWCFSSVAFCQASSGEAESVCAVKRTLL